MTDGIRLAGVLGSHLTFITVMVPFATLGDLGHAFSGSPETVRRQAIAFLEFGSREALSNALAAAKSAGLTADTLMVENEHPHEAIIAAAKSKNVDLILMASHGRSGAKAILLGSVTQKVLAHTNLSVLVYR